MSEVKCPTCSREFDSTHGFNVHWGRSHEGPTPDGVDTTYDEEVCEKISESLRGRELSEETKQKMSEAKQGENHWIYGQERSDGYKQRMKEVQTGENNSNWEHGRTSNWVNKRQEIRARDNYECQVCGISKKEQESKYNRNLNVHHIVERDRFLRNGEYLSGVNDELNLVTVCDACHNRVENMTGPKTVRDEPFSVMEPYRRAQE